MTDPIVGKTLTASVVGAPVVNLDGVLFTLPTGDSNGLQDSFIKNIQTGEVSLVAGGATGAPLLGNASTADAIFSSDGSKIAFISVASNLVAGDTNGGWDVFVKDLATGFITRVSTTSTGQQTTGGQSLPQFGLAWSPDGTKLAFGSFATNLAPGATDANNDIFVKDVVNSAGQVISNGAIQQITINAGVEADGASYFPHFSSDGTKVVFQSTATTLVAGDTNGNSDIFIKYIAAADGHLAGDVVRISTDSAGGQGTGGDSTNAVFSPDGTKVAFSSTGTFNGLGADSGVDIFVKYLADADGHLAGDLVRVSKTTAAVDSGGSDLGPVFSADGSKIVFYSNASYGIAGDTNANVDVFIKDLATGIVSRVSETAGHVVGDGASQYASFSPDGTKVLFYSTSANLVPGDTNFVAGQTFSGADWFVKDLTTGAVTRVSTDAAGLQGNPVGGFGALYQSFTYSHWSPDSAFVTFDANFDNLLPGAATLTAAGALSFIGTPVSNGASSTIDWSYNPANANLDFLREGQTLTITYNVQVNDGTANSNTQPLTITITGKNDAPVLASVSAPAAVPVLAANSSSQDIAPIHGALLTTDKDAGDTLTASISGSPVINLVTNGVTTPFTLPNGAAALTGALSFDSTVASDGGLKAINWTYDPGPAVLNFLSQGQSLTLAYTVKVNDGSVDSNTQVLMVTITGANAPVVTESLAFDTGASTTDRVTSNAALSGTGLANTLVHFTIDGSPIVATVTTDPLGAWSFAPTGLTDGAHTIVASQTDGFGHTGTATLIFTLDTAVPAAPTTPDLASMSDSGNSTDNNTNLAAATFTGTAEAGSTVTIFSDGVAIGSGVPTSGTYTITTSALTDGTHSITAKATDTAGNTSLASAALSVVIDTAAPAAPSTPDLASASDSGNSTDNYTNISAATFTGTAEAGSTVTIFSDGVAVGSGVATSGTYSITTSALVDGMHSITAKATDTAGNTSLTSAALSVVIDTAAPTAPSTPDLASVSDSGNGIDNNTNVAAATFTGTAEAGSTVTIFSDGVAVGSGVATGGNYSITTSALADGPHSITAKATDTAGNASAASAALSVVIDTAAPAAPSTPDLAAASDSGNSTDNNTNVAAATFTGTAEAGSTVTIFSDGVAVGSGVATGGNYSIPTSALADGPHSITAKATDTAGNASLASAALAVVIDTAKPAETLAITSIANSSSPTDQTIIVSGSNSALVTGDKVQISADGFLWTDVVQNTATSWSFVDSVARTANLHLSDEDRRHRRQCWRSPSRSLSASPIMAVRSRLEPHRLSSHGNSGRHASVGSPGITGTVNVISIASGPVVISGNASVTSATGDAIDLSATGGTQVAPANLSINLTGPITGAASGITVVQNASGSITITTSGPVIGQAGQGISVQQGATGVGNILVNGSGNVTGTGAGFSGILAQNLNTANNGDVTISQTGNISGGRDGIRAQTNGNGNITVTTGSNATITGSLLYGIEAFSNGRGNIAVATATGDTINSGSVGINVYNQATSIPQVGGLTNSFISVTANGTINSGTTYTGSGARPAGILAGYKGGTTNTSNSTAFGNVTVDNFANINAAGGDGIRAFQFRPRQRHGQQPAARSWPRTCLALPASSNGTGKVSITMEAGCQLSTPARPPFGDQSGDGDSCGRAVHASA